MPNSNFTLGGSGSGDYDIIADAWAGFLSGLASGGVSVTGMTLGLEVVPVPVGYPPSVVDNGPGNDVECTAPYFEPEDHVTYTLRYTDNGGTSWVTVNEISPSSPLTVPNGYNSGRQFSIFANETPGALSTALP